MPNVGHITLITDDTAYCRVTWGKAKTANGACGFSVRIPTHRGESWQTRKVKAIAEARRVAAAFLEITDADDVRLTVGAGTE